MHFGGTDKMIWPAKTICYPSHEAAVQLFCRAPLASCRGVCPLSLKSLHAIQLIFTCASSLPSNLADIAVAAGVHADRIIGGNRHYCHSGGSAVTGAKPCRVPGQSRKLHFQLPSMGDCRQRLCYGQHSRIVALLQYADY